MVLPTAKNKVTVFDLNNMSVPISNVESSCKCAVAGPSVKLVESRSLPPMPEMFVSLNDTNSGTEAEIIRDDYVNIMNVQPEFISSPKRKRSDSASFSKKNHFAFPSTKIDYTEESQEIRSPFMVECSSFSGRLLEGDLSSSLKEGGNSMNSISFGSMSANFVEDENSLPQINSEEKTVSKGRNLFCSSNGGNRPIAPKFSNIMGSPAPVRRRSPRHPYSEVSQSTFPTINSIKGLVTGAVRRSTPLPQPSELLMYPAEYLDRAPLSSRALTPSADKDSSAVHMEGDHSGVAGPMSILTVGKRRPRTSSPEKGPSQVSPPPQQQQHTTYSPDALPADAQLLASSGSVRANRAVLETFASPPHSRPLFGSATTFSAPLFGQRQHKSLSRSSAGELSSPFPSDHLQQKQRHGGDLAELDLGTPLTEAGSPAILEDVYYNGGADDDLAEEGDAIGNFYELPVAGSRSRPFCDSDSEGMNSSMDSADAPRPREAEWRRYTSFARRLISGDTGVEMVDERASEISQRAVLEPRGCATPLPCDAPPQSSLATGVGWRQVARDRKSEVHSAMKAASAVDSAIASNTSLMGNTTAGSISLSHSRDDMHSSQLNEHAKEANESTRSACTDNSDSALCGAENVYDDGGFALFPSVSEYTAGVKVSPPAKEGHKRQLPPPSSSAKGHGHGQDGKVSASSNKQSVSAVNRPLPDQSAFESFTAPTSSISAGGKRAPNCPFSPTPACPPTPARTPIWGAAHEDVVQSISRHDATRQSRSHSHILRGRNPSSTWNAEEPDLILSTTGSSDQSRRGVHGGSTRFGLTGRLSLHGGAAHSGGPLPAQYMQRQSSLSESKLLLSSDTSEEDCHLFHHNDGLHNQPTQAIDFARDFDNLGVLGSGTFGDVYKVRSKLASDQSHLPAGHPARLFAVKKSRKQFRSKRDREWFMEEVRTMKLLGSRQSASRRNSHSAEEAKEKEKEKDCEKRDDGGEQRHPSRCEYIVQFIRAWQEDFYFYVQIDLVEKGTVRDLVKDVMKAGKVLPESTIWHIVHDVSAGLDHIHSCGMVHLDIKSANLLISAKGVVKIGDFGMAAAIDSREDGHEGDTRYMANELLNNCARKPSADVFSLGLTLYELSYSEAQLAVFLEQNLRDEVISLPSQGHQWHVLRSGEAEPLRHRSSALAQLVAHAMAKEPEDRPSTAFILSVPEVAAVSPGTDREAGVAQADETLLSARTILPAGHGLHRSTSFLPISSHSDSSHGLGLTIDTGLLPLCDEADRAFTPHF